MKMRGGFQCHGRLRADLLTHIPPRMPQRVRGQAVPPEVSMMVAAGAICRAPFQPIVLCRDGEYAEARPRGSRDPSTLESSPSSIHCGDLGVVFLFMEENGIS